MDITRLIEDDLAWIFGDDAFFEKYVLDLGEGGHLEPDKKKQTEHADDCQ